MTVRFTLTAGALVRGSLRRALEEARFDLEGEGGGLEWREGKGWLSSDFHIRAHGPEEMVDRLIRWVKSVGEAE